MRRNREGGLGRRLFYSRATLTLLAALVFVFGMSVWDIFMKSLETGERRAQAEQELAGVLEREAALEEEMSRLETRRGVEEALREKYNVAKEGEELVIIVEPESAAAANASAGRESVWQRVRSFFDWF